MTFDIVREFLGFSVGLLYLWWEYHANPKVWLASGGMPAISMWIYYSKGLYADFAINIYYLVIAVYGFIIWTHGSHTSDSGEKTVQPISHPTPMVWLGAMLSAGVLWGAIWFVLVNYTDSTVPVADSFTTALSIVGLWMLAKKYAEQWLVWFIVDIVCCGLYFYKGLYFYSTLYCIYTVIALLGYRKWLRMMSTQ